MNWKNVVIVVCCLLIVACERKRSRTVGGELSHSQLQIGVTQEFENFNPVIMSMLATTYMYSMAGRALVYLDRNAEWQPQLATSIPTLENDKARFFEEDGVRKIAAEWEIRESAKWGDGTAVTCQDLKFAWEVARNENVSVGEREMYNRIERIEIDGDNPKRCTLIHSPATWDFNQIGRFFPLPEHLERDIFEKHKETSQGYEQNSLYTRDPLNPGLYNGPYLVTDMQLSSHVTFERNPYFYGEEASFEKIIVKLIPNTGTLEANLRSGTIDMISVLGLSFDQALAFQERVKSENLPYDVNFQPGLVYEHIDLNLDNPILKDKKVRQALVYAIDRDGLSQALFQGKQEPAIHNLAPIDPWYTDDPEKIRIYSYNRRQAARLLDEAGWELSDDGIRYKDGERLRFVLMTTSGNRLREMVQTFLQEKWKAVGIDIAIRNEPARVFFGETTRKRQFPHMAMYAWISSPESNPRSTLSSASISREENGWSGQNYPGWVNERVDELIEKIDVTFDSEKRLEFIHEILKYYTEEVPVIPLYYRSDISVTPKGLLGYQLTGHQYSTTNEIERWHLKK